MSDFLTSEALDQLRSLTTDLKRLRKMAGAVVTAESHWDLKALRQRLPELAKTLDELTEGTRQAQASLSGWSLAADETTVTAYESALRDAAARADLSLSGEFPSFETFPLSFRIDLAQEQVTIGRRQKRNALRPDAVVAEIQSQVKRLNRSSFNATRFLKALTEAHRLLLKSGKGQGTSVFLLDIYDLLSLRTGAAGYSRQEFIWDIHRLRRDSDLVYEGHRLSFVNSKRRTLEIPNSHGGVEVFSMLEVEELEDGA